jgi:hypothetical protein
MVRDYVYFITWNDHFLYELMASICYEIHTFLPFKVIRKPIKSTYTHIFYLEIVSYTFVASDSTYHHSWYVTLESRDTIFDIFLLQPITSLYCVDQNKVPCNNMQNDWNIWCAVELLFFENVKINQRRSFQFLQRRHTH